MKAKKHPLQILEDNLKYFQSLVSIQSDSSRFNAIGHQVELRITIIIQYIKKDGINVSMQDCEFAFVLLQKYITLWELYFKNHPWQPLNKK